ncbi:MAG: BMP family ABC transporter substrate-binding protein [Selenomonadaceae bacterium]|nr:BMP family ABC transporter substrate-binding protein [Selenomonadaceae bacterium]
MKIYELHNQIKRLSDEKKLKILLVLGGCVLFLIIILLVFGFDTTPLKEKPKIGFIILGDIRQSGWNASHYNGIKSACDEFDVELLVRDKVPDNSGQCPIAVEELIAEGAHIIFLVSFDYSLEVRPLMEKYPNIAFIDVSTQTSAKNLTHCFAKMYEGRYLSGVLAGLRTKTNVIGYVAAMPNSEVNRGISAFTLGVQRINPNAKVVVAWTGDWENPEKEKMNAERLISEVGADVLTYHQDDSAVGDVADSLGIDFIGYNALLKGYSEHYLTSIICNWELFYQDILQRYLKGELSSIRNHWVGIQQGIISLSDYSVLIDEDTKRAIEEARNDLVNGKLIFSDDIYDNEGKLRCSKNKVISDMELLKNINWLIRGVEVLE